MHIIVLLHIVVHVVDYHCLMCSLKWVIGYHEYNPEYEHFINILTLMSSFRAAVFYTSIVCKNCFTCQMHNIALWCWRANTNKPRLKEELWSHSSRGIFRYWNMLHNLQPVGSPSVMPSLNCHLQCMTSKWFWTRVFYSVLALLDLIIPQTVVEFLII